MTHHELRRVEPDGTRVYDNYHRYTPLAPAERKYAVRKPDDPRAVRWGGQWLLPLELLSDDNRVMPATRPDSATLEHRAWCRCEVCERPQAAILWSRRDRAEARARRGSSAQPAPPPGRR